MDRMVTLSSPAVEYPGSEPFAKRQVSKAPSHLSRLQYQNASVEESGTVSWPLLRDEFTITSLFSIREEKKAKTQLAMSFGQGHARRAYTSKCFLKRFIW